MGRMMASLLAVAVGARIASATAQGLPATDNELYAGYCLGVSETMPEFALKLYDRPPYSPAPPLPGNTPGEREFNRKLPEFNRQNQEWDRQNQEAKGQTAQLLKQQQQRFASYLMSRGVLLSMERTDAFFGVLTARRRGQAEARDCSSQINDQSNRCLAIRESESRRLDWLRDSEEARKQDERSWQEYQACLNHVTASSPPVCDRMARCSKPDSLPF